MHKFKKGDKILMLVDNYYCCHKKKGEVVIIDNVTAKRLVLDNGTIIPINSLGDAFELYYEPGDYLVCIDNSDGYQQQFTLGERYEVLEPTRTLTENDKVPFITIQSDMGKRVECFQNRFERIIEPVETKDNTIKVDMNKRENKVKDKQSDGLADALSKVVQDSLGGMVKTELDSFKSEIRKEVNSLTESMPVLEVKVGDVKKPTKLSTKANPLLPRLIVNSKLGLYTMLVGPAGCGKTTLANQLAEALKTQFGAVCLTAGASETWLFGRQTANGFVEGPFAKLYKEGGVFLADEMDAADANLLLSMNTALSHDEFINPMNGELMKKHKDFVFVGAANTNGKGANHIYTGRARLDAATLDRFIILDMNYDGHLEKTLCSDDNIRNFLNDLRSRLEKKQLDEFISTRAYKNMDMMHKAGIPYRELVDSLISNWSDVAKKEAEQSWDNVLRAVKEDIPEDNLFKVVGGKSPKQKIRKLEAKEVDYETPGEEIPF